MAAVDPKFWRGKKVLITGHTGFKGSWLAEWLTLMSAGVTGFSLAPSTQPNHFQLLKSGYASVFGDIRDSDALGKVLKSVQPDVVIHLAAQALVRPSYADPEGTYATNVMGTLNLLQVIRSVPSVKVALMITSDKCYENRETTRPYREGDAMGGFDPYSSSKGCMELLVASMRRSFFAEGECLVASARAGNVIGGGDWAKDRLIPDVVRAWGNGTPAEIRNLQSVRPWQHVLDPLSGYLILAQRLWEKRRDMAKGWNFGPAPGMSWPVERIVEMCKACLPGFQYVVKASPEHEANVLVLDSTQAQIDLGWEPRWSIEKALSTTLQWYRSFYENGKLLTSEQILQFSEDC